MQDNQNVLNKLSAIVLVLAACAATGCYTTGVSVAPSAPEPAAQPAAPSYPAFPTEQPFLLPQARTTAETASLSGNAFAEQSALSGSYELSAHTGSYALVPPSGSSFAWARYEFTGLTGDRPVSIIVNTGDAPATDGGDDVLPQVWWVGIADYTTYSWDWRGPFSGTITLPLNQESPALRDRYVSASGTLHAVILADASEVPPTAGNPDGLATVRVDSVAAETSPDYLQNLPHWAGFTYTAVGSGSKGASELADKCASTLRPEQFTYLEWFDVPAFNTADELNAADAYVLTRQGPLDETPLEVFNGLAGEFIDPLSLEAGIAHPRGGTQYTYSIHAENEAGATAVDFAQLMIPILAPLSLTASLNTPGQDYVKLGWLAADGAELYRIYRGESILSSQSTLITTVAGDQLSYYDAQAPPGLEWYYFVRAEGVGDGDITNGQEPGQLSGYSLGAKGLRTMIFSLDCTTAGVSGSGSSAEPYQLSSGNEYQFHMADQDGTDFTPFSAWTVDPPSAASFAASPAGLLTDIMPSADAFTITAEYSYQAYSWQATALCTAE